MIAAVSPALTTFLIETANFLVLAAVLGWLLFRPVRASIARRQAALAQQAADAAAKLAEAERQRAEIERRLTALEAELEQRRAAAAAAADEEAKRIVAAAREAAAREVEGAKRRLAGLEQAGSEQLARAVADSAGAIVDRLLRSLDQQELNRALVAAACRQLRTFNGNSLAPVRVESAQPLDPAARTELAAALGQAADSAAFLVDETLGSGLRIATSRGLVDVSASGMAAFAARSLADRLNHAQDHAQPSPTGN